MLYSFLMLDISVINLQCFLEIFSLSIVNFLFLMEPPSFSTIEFHSLKLLYFNIRITFIYQWQIIFQLLTNILF